jgi:hypothetical protein
MAKERLCGFKVGEVVQLQVEIELFGKEQASSAKRNHKTPCERK